MRMCSFGNDQARLALVELVELLRVGLARRSVGAEHGAAVADQVIAAAAGVALALALRVHEDDDRLAVRAGIGRGLSTRAARGAVVELQVAEVRRFA
jgi:hypothetical protein